MKRIFLSLLLICLLQTVYGQISGKLTDKSGHPISHASVLLLRSSDTSLVKAVSTDETGAYQVQYNGEGKYILQISCVGHDTWNSPEFELTASRPAKDFGIHVMEANGQTLAEVSVRATKPLIQQNAYGTIVNVESSILTKGSSVLQIIERSPGVIIDRRNNDIAMNGKSGVVVMLNGKLMRMSAAQLLTMLDGMSADDITTIELLTTPPAGYDAEGSAGLINIVLKKNRKRGTNGSFSLSGGYGRREKGTGSINLAHNRRNINLYGSYTFLHNNSGSDLLITSTQDMPDFGGKLAVYFTSNAKFIQTGHDARTGIDIKPDTSTTIGANLSWSSSSFNYTALNHLLYNVLPDSLLVFDGTIRGDSRSKNMISSAYFEKTLGKSDKLSIDLDYIYFNHNMPSAITSSFIDKNGNQAGNNDTMYSPVQHGFANTTIQVGVGRIDYTKQLNEKIKLETGIKNTHTTVSSSSGLVSLVNGVWENRDDTVNDIKMNEKIGAIYTSMSAQLNPSTNLAIGARYEYATTRMYEAKDKKLTINRRMGVLFPTVFLTRKINDRSDLQLSYTKRISRPSYNDLASYAVYADPTAVLTGNSFLKPTITSNIKLGYNYKSYAFSLLFSRDDNPIVRYQLTENAARDLIFVSPQNLAWQNNLNLQANVPVRVNSWWNMSYGFTGGWRHFKLQHTKQPAEKKYMGYNLNFTQAFLLPKNVSVELSGFYNSTSYNGTVRAMGWGSLNAGIKKELGNNKGSFQLSVTDFLRTLRTHSYNGAVTAEAFDIKSHVRYSAESRKFPIIRLSYSRSFGSASTKNQRKPNAVPDETERIRSN
jgi:outer membrane receptor protein involved in Fe transport